MTKAHSGRNHLGQLLPHTLSGDEKRIYCERMSWGKNMPKRAIGDKEKKKRRRDQREI